MFRDKNGKYHCPKCGRFIHRVAYIDASENNSVDLICKKHGVVG